MSTRMAALDELLADADELLDQADAQTIDECLERGEAPDHVAGLLGCTWCGHDFHGLPCGPPVEFLVASLQFVDEDDAIDDAALPLSSPWINLWACRCQSSLDHVDDTWRPIWSGDAEEKMRHDVAWHMHKTGLDGWSARADLALRRRARGVAFQQLAEKAIAAGEVIVAGFTELGDAIFTAIAGALPTVPTVPFRGEVLGTTPDVLIVDEIEPPESPAARALRLQQSRSTGPERPPATRARRPRTHR